jgi:ABC-2 type transport system ATP-binding protein
MTRLLVCAELVRARYGYREVLSGVSFDLRRGQALGIVGPAGAGKTTMLRLLAGLLAPAGGTLQIDGRAPHLASRRTAVGYFAGDFTLPGSVRADAWGRLATGTVLTVERRPLRALSRGARQMLGLRATLARERLDLVLLDEPWETLDADGSAWLTSTLLTKRDHGASLVLTSEQHHDLVRVCDVFLVMLHQRGVLVHAHQLNPSGIATAADLDAAIEALRTPAPPLRPVAEAVEAGRAPEVQSGLRLDGTDLSPPSQPG